VDLTLKQLEIFNAVVVSGSISRAARRLHLSQPTISQQLAKMETQLGTQLLLRNRGPEVTLTPAGEYWFRCSTSIMTELEASYTQDERQFSGRLLTLRFGATPSLRRRFISGAANLSLEEKEFSRFEFIWALSSGELVEMMNLHQLDCAVVTEESVGESRSTLSVAPLFDDQIVWAVPKSIPAAMVQQTLLTGRPLPQGHGALLRYVDVDAPVPWHEATRSWYREHLPFALPYFGCMTHQAAIDLVDAGLATCHAPLSLFPSLPKSTISNLRLFRLDKMVRKAVLIMPRHLLSLAPYATFRANLIDFATRQYSKEMEPAFPDAIPSVPAHSGAV
jgi:DNA-binding transcriptional LysR family regulator